MWCCDAITSTGVCDNAVGLRYISVICFRSCKYVRQFKVTYEPDWAGCYICYVCVTIFALYDAIAHVTVINKFQFQYITCLRAIPDQGAFWHSQGDLPFSLHNLQHLKHIDILN